MKRIGYSKIIIFETEEHNKLEADLYALYKDIVGKSIISSGAPLMSKNQIHTEEVAERIARIMKINGIEPELYEIEFNGSEINIDGMFYVNSQ